MICRNYSIYNYSHFSNHFVSRSIPVAFELSRRCGEDIWSQKLEWQGSWQPLQVYLIFFWLIYFMCMIVLTECMYVHHPHAYCLCRLEKGIRFPRTRVLSYYVSGGNWTRFSTRETSSLIHWAAFPSPDIFNFNKPSPLKVYYVFTSKSLEI